MGRRRCRLSLRLGKDWQIMRMVAKELYGGAVLARSRSRCCGCSGAAASNPAIASMLRNGSVSMLSPVARPLLWLHTVSVGETRAAEPLVEALRERWPEQHILLTHMTPTGRETGAQVFGASVSSCYLPYDLPMAVSRFLSYFQPRLGILRGDRDLAQSDPCVPRAGQFRSIW